MPVKVCPHCRTQYGPEQLVCPNDGARLDEGGAPADALIGQTLAERYRIIRTLGEGGMGRVYLGEHVRMGRLSAIKVMHPALAPTSDAIGRFNREAANASRINHPHVAAIYDFGETADGTLYLAMEYIEGETLAQLLAREGSLSLQRTAALTKQITDALEAAHKLGIVHRDLKPDNILITRDDSGADFAKVVDFGIAKSMRAAGQTVTTAGVSIGTPAFMSPEQLAGGELDHRSDVYSLGLVVYSMLTGTSAYPEPSSKEALVERLTARPRPLSQMRPAVSWAPQLQAALDRALSPDVHERYDKAADFARDLSAAVNATAPIPAVSDTDVRTKRMTPVVTKRIETPDTTATSPVAVRSSRKPFVVAGVVAAVAAFAAVFAMNGSFSGTKAPDVAVTHDSLPPITPAPVAAAPETVAHTKAAASAPRIADGSSSTAKKDTSAPAPTKPVASTLVAPPTADSIVTTPRPDGASKRAGKHAWLRASGDSSAQALTAPSLLAGEAREVMGHINKAKRFFNAKDVEHAMPEMRTAFEEFNVFSAEHPGTQETRAIGQQLRGAMNQVLIACRTSTDSAAIALRSKLPCDNVERAARSALRNGELPDPAGRNGRRMQRPTVNP